MWLRIASTNINSASLAIIASRPAPSASDLVAAATRLAIHCRLSSDTGACTMCGRASSSGLKGRASQPKKVFWDFEHARACRARCQNADSMSRRTMLSGEDLPAHPARSGPSAPVFDAVMVRGEAVVNAPQNRLGATGDVDLAIDRSDVGLYGVRAEVGECCYLSVAFALGD
jgi:hypothetical protein